MRKIDNRPNLFGDTPGDHEDSTHPPLELTFTVAPERIPRLKLKLQEYEKREADRDAGFQHPAYRVLRGDAQEMYKPLVLAAILDATRDNPQAVITITDIAAILSGKLGLNVRPAAIPYVWSENFMHYVPDMEGISQAYKNQNPEADALSIAAGIAFSSAYSIVSDHASGQDRFIVPGSGTGLPE